MLLGGVTGVQCAYKVRLLVTCVAKLYGVPPSASVYQPAKVYPDRVGALGCATVAPQETVSAAVAVPCWESKLTVTGAI
ncbi:hypothetical protein [Amycolatopsis sp. SID8362]|uniref:hypothetical protein n=1 Tax=Amycolatopsis sp. SID8362 TaxID=2690346 RepID=UPI001EF1AC0F|nr:hypothetical protein [Amycolatopsis sp. SID8362]